MKYSKSLNGRTTCKVSSLKVMSLTKAKKKTGKNSELSLFTRTVHGSKMPETRWSSPHLKPGEKHLSNNIGTCSKTVQWQNK